MVTETNSILSYARSCLGALLIALPLAGCDPPPPVTPVTPIDKANDGKETKTKDQKAANDGQLGKQTRVASEKLLDRRANTALAPDTLDEVKPQAAPPPKSTSEIYSVVAPATVIIRVPNGMGSGVIVDPDGWVLTNHHVIENGPKKDFEIQATVLTGKMSKELGAMERSSKTYKAEVYKADKLRDIALLKLIDAPKNLPAIKIAKKKPRPGDRITSLGHAGAGMLWAVKSCQIAALGKLTDHLARIAHFKDDDSGRKALKAFRKHISSFQLGMVIQSTCNILPGDSGGPVVNEQAELIGLNVFTKRDRKTGGLLSFHVHLNEIEKFMEARPDSPQKMLPDPWKDGGGDLVYEDSDLDGRVDAIVMKGRKPCSFCPTQSRAILFDVDQSSFKQNAALPDLQDVYEKRSFDAEAIFLQLKRDVFVWYDTDNDGAFDVLLYDKRANGKVDSAYRIDSSGKLTVDEALKAGKPFRSALFPNAELGSRFGKMTRTAFPPHFSDGEAARGDSLPPPISLAGRARRKDLDRNGKPDAVDVRSSYSRRLLVDGDGNFAGKMKRGFPMAKVDPKTLDPELSVVSQTNQIWTWYDTDNDGKFDLVLHAPGPRVYVAKNAWTIDADGVRTVAPEHVGRKLIRSGVYRSDALRASFKPLVKRGFLNIMASKKGDGISSFPDPVHDHRGAGFEVLKLRRSPGMAVSVVGRGSDGYLLDLDRNSGLTRPKVNAGKLAKAGKIEAEFAYFRRGNMAWALYDTNNDGKFDLVLVSTNPKDGQATVGYRIDTKDEALYDASLINGPLIRPGLFKRPYMKQRFKTLAPELFSPAMLKTR